MIVFPNAKINLGLRILRKRQDGFHDIETAYYPLPFFDILEITLADTFEFTQTGLKINGNPGDNLCVKAFNALRKNTKKETEAVHIHLHKRIPTGAGLGGGSSDAAYCLKILNELLDTGLNREQLKDIASGLGADCAFFIDNKPGLATGIGDQIEPLKLDLTGYFIALVTPGIHISTPEAYKNAYISETPDVFKSISYPVKDWKNRVLNDFEKYLFLKYPALENIKLEMYEKGALYASMSGSGSSIFGIFRKKTSETFNNEKAHWFELSGE